MQANDLDQVAILFDLYRQFYKQQPDLDLARDFIQARFTKNESSILVAENADQELVGFCQLYPSFCSVEAKPIYTLYDLFVLPTARKQGVGKLLLEAAERKAASESKSRMDLTTATDNKTAQSLYESLGWIRDKVFLTYNRWIDSDNKN
jgi:ribosomal protein S18 acetylase RimI-like enzyme